MNRRKKRKQEFDQAELREIEKLFDEVLMEREIKKRMAEKKAMDSMGK